MKKRATTALLLFLALLPILAQGPDIIWQRTYGGSGHDYAIRLLRMADGGFLIGGNTASTNGQVTGNHGEVDVWLLRTDPHGVLLWQRTYGGSGQDHLSDIKALPDGGFILVCNTNSNNGDVTGNHGGADGWVLRLNGEGDIQWQRALGSSSSDALDSVALIPDGGFMLAGSTYGNDGDVAGNNGASDCWLVRLSEEGELISQHCFGGPATDGSNSLVLLPDGTFLVAATIGSAGGDIGTHHGMTDIWVFRSTLDHELLWERSFGGEEEESASNLIVAEDGGCLVLGSAWGAGGDVTESHGFVDAWVLKLDAVGTLQWQRSLGGSGIDRVRDAWPMPDGDYLLACRTESADGLVTENFGQADGWLVKLNGAGAVQRQRSYGGSGRDDFLAILREPAGTWVVAGLSSSTDGQVGHTHGGDDFWLVRLQGEGVGVAEQDAWPELCAWMDPTGGAIMVAAGAAVQGLLHLVLYDASGRRCGAWGQPTGASTLRLPVGDLASGVHLLHVSDGQRTAMRRVLQLR